MIITVLEKQLPQIFRPVKGSEICSGLSIQLYSYCFLSLSCLKSYCFWRRFERYFSIFKCRVDFAGQLLRLVSDVFLLINTVVNIVLQKEQNFTMESWPKHLKLQHFRPNRTKCLFPFSAKSV